ncbi:haloacid dehalogenase type II [Kribbella sp. NPDC026611]|uniref:haloacid dehalogenase type II n=1 Tax=Kribbella sp. NPDC026611 TaxID=3154911 RepID=UPI0033EFF73A
MDIDVLVLDVNETLTDLEPLRDRFAQAGLPRESLDVWFAATLRDGFALTAAGAYAEFRTIGADILTELLGVSDEEVVNEVLKGFTTLPLHPDVAPGLTRIHEAGIRIITLTNGSAAMSQQVFADGGILDLLEHRLDVGVPQRWKPHPDSYRHAADVCGVPVERMGLAAVHPWDIDGAQRAGLTGIHIDRRKTPYPKAFRTPDVTVPDFQALAEALPAKES